MLDRWTAPLKNSVLRYTEFGNTQTLLRDESLVLAVRLRAGWVSIDDDGPYDDDVVEVLTLFFWARAHAKRESEQGVEWRRLADLGRRALVRHRDQSMALLWQAAADTGAVLNQIVGDAATALHEDEFDQAAGLLGSLLDLLPEGNSQRSEAAAWLGVMRAVSWSDMGSSLGDAPDGLRAMALAADLPEEPDSATQTVLTRLGATLWERYRQERHPADLRLSLPTLRRASRGSGTAAQANARSLLGVALRELFDDSGRLEQLQESITWQTLVVESDADSATRASSRAQLIASMMDRFRLDGHDRSLGAAVEMARRGLSEADAEDTRLDVLHGLLGGCLGESFRRWGRAHDIDEAIVNLRKAVQLAPTDDDRAPAASDLSSELQSRFEAFARGEDIDEALRAARLAVSLTSATHPNWALRESNLADAFRLRGMQAPSGDDLDEAIRRGRSILMAVPPSDPRRSLYAERLGNALLRRYAVTSQRADLDEGIVSLEEAVAMAGEETVQYYGNLANLARALDARYRTTGDTGDEDAAISRLRHVVQQLPSAHPTRLGAVTQLAGCLVIRGRREMQRADLEEAIALLGRELPAIDPASPVYLDALSHLGRAEAALVRFTDDGSPLEEALRHLRQAAAVATAGTPQDSVQQALSEALRQRFEIHGDLDDLTQAIEVRRDLMARIPRGALGRASEQMLLSEGLSVRAELTGSRNDAEEAVALAREIVVAVDHPDFAPRLGNLGTCLRRRYFVVGDVADLDEAVVVTGKAVDGAPSGHTDLPTLLSNLALTLAQRFERTGRRADIDEALRHGRLAVEIDAITDGTAWGAGVHANTGLVAMNRFEAFGELADLELGVAEARRAVQSTPEGHPDRPMYESNLATGLWARFARLRQRSDVLAAADILRAAIRRVPAHDVNRGGYLANLAGTLHALHEDRADISMLREAVIIGQEAIDSTSVEHPYRVRYVADNATHRYVLFKASGDSHHLDAAVEQMRSTLAQVVPGHAERASFLSNFSGMLRARFEFSHDSGDLQEAIKHLRDALTDSPQHSVAAATYALNLGLALRVLPDGADAHDEAMAYFLSATRNTAAANILRVRSAFEAARLAGSLERWSLATDLYTETVQLLPALAWHGLDRGTQETLMTGLSGIVSAAAGAAIRAGRPRSAVELLEQGRSVLWQHILNANTDLSLLQRAAPELADRLTALRRRLDDDGITLPARGDLMAGDRVSAASALRLDEDARLRVAREWDETVDRVRDVPGFADFLRPARFDRLRPPGPVAIINASGYGCHALVVHGGSVTVVDLDVSITEVGDRAQAHLEAISRLGEMDEHALAAANRDLSDLLDWLRTHVTGPVLAALRAETLQTGTRSITPAADGTAPTDGVGRVWWCPTGAFSVLPLHASVLEDVTSSYTPTISLLRPANARPGQNYTIVGVGHASGQSELPFVEDEIRTVLEHFPVDGSSGQVLRDESATVAAVVDGIVTSSWVHLACHAWQNLLNPSDSGLALSDGGLRILDLIADTRGRRLSGDLAYLSACETATGGLQLLDEAIHLAGAFQVLGFRQVISTMWSADDRSSALIAADFYARVSQGGSLDAERAAHALAAATRRLRDAVPDQPLLWATFVHSGP